MFSISVPIFVTAITTPCILLLASGKGDNFIAGYNSATGKERDSYNIKRLRGVMIIALCLMTLLFWLPYIFESSGIDINIKVAMGIMILGIVVTSMVTFILAETYAKKK